VTFTPMAIAGAWVHTPKVWPDERGTFHEVFKLSAISEQLGRDFTVKQVNQSLSSKGVIRGIHWTDSEEGQAKYVSCPAGSLWDVVVDLRPESATFGKWDAVLLTAENKKSVLISEGLGHGFLALEDGTLANYLCSSEFDPAGDKTISPLSPTLSIDFQFIAASHGLDAFLLSSKDSEAEYF
jgi:dTDP-4-dehydrorhamnose 3,5-epimerase